MLQYLYTASSLAELDFVGMRLADSQRRFLRTRRNMELIASMILDKSVNNTVATAAADDVNKALKRNGNSVTLFVNGLQYVMTRAELGSVTETSFYAGTTPNTTGLQISTALILASTAASGSQKDDWLDTQAKTIIITISCIMFLITIAVVIGLVVLRYRQSALQSERKAQKGVFMDSFVAPVGHYYPGVSPSVFGNDTVVDYHNTSTKKGEFHYYPASNRNFQSGEYININENSLIDLTGDSQTPLENVLTTHELSRLVELVHDWQSDPHEAGLGGGEPNQYRDPAPNPLFARLHALSRGPDPSSRPTSRSASVRSTTPAQAKQDDPAPRAATTLVSAGTGASVATGGVDPRISIDEEPLPPTANQDADSDSGDDRFGFSNIEDIVQNWSEEEDDNDN